MNDDLNDNDAPRDDDAEQDSHGRAAILLVESLIHSLIERSLISVEDAVAIGERAAEAQADINLDNGAKQSETPDSLAILTTIVASLKIDV